MRVEPDTLQPLPRRRTILCKGERDVASSSSSALPKLPKQLAKSNSSPSLPLHNNKARNTVLTGSTTHSSASRLRSSDTELRASLRRRRPVNAFLLGGEQSLPNSVSPSPLKTEMEQISQRTRPAIAVEPNEKLEDLIARLPMASQSFLMSLPVEPRRSLEEVVADPTYERAVVDSVFAPSEVMEDDPPPPTPPLPRAEPPSTDKEPMSRLRRLSVSSSKAAGSTQTPLRQSQSDQRLATLRVTDALGETFASGSSSRPSRRSSRSNSRDIILDKQHAVRRPSRKSLSSLLDEMQVPEVVVVRERQAAQRQAATTMISADVLRKRMLRPDTFDRIIDLFPKVDTDGNGSLDEQEFTNAINQTIDDANPADVTKLFREIDRDRSGLISYEELKDAFRTAAERAARSKYVEPPLPVHLQRNKRDIFLLYRQFEKQGVIAAQSTNENVAKFVTAPAFEQCLRMFYPNQTKEDITSMARWSEALAAAKAAAQAEKTRRKDEELVAALDVDSSGTISVNEFVELSRRTGLTKVQLRARFRDKDYDNTGTLNMNQMVDVLHELREERKVRASVPKVKPANPAPLRASMALMGDLVVADRLWRHAKQHETDWSRTPTLRTCRSKCQRADSGCGIKRGTPCARASMIASSETECTSRHRDCGCKQAFIQHSM